MFSCGREDGAVLIFALDRSSEGNRTEKEHFSFVILLV
jgi:hypothetical protein